MAFLTATPPRGASRGSALRARGRFAALMLALVALPLAASTASAPAEPVREYQIKAVFLFNFTQFVEWPPGAFSDARSPFVIGVLGEDPFGTYLDDVVRGERVDDRPLVVQRCRNTEGAAACHILFISRSEAPRFEQILTDLRGRNILTVGDAKDFARRGGMIRLFTENNKIRLRINVDAAKAAGLTISSKLLRPSEVVTQGKD